MESKRIGAVVLGLMLALPAAAENKPAQPGKAGAQPRTTKQAAKPAEAEAAKTENAAPGKSALEAELEQLKNLLLQQTGELAAQRALIQQQQEKMTDLERRLQSPDENRDSTHGAEGKAQQLDLLEGQLEAVADNQKELGQRVGKVEKDVSDNKKATEGKLKGLGNFAFSGDVRLRYEPFIQGGGFVTRQRERIRARLNITGKLSDEISGGISIATGSLDDVNSTNQTMTGFFTRKPIGFDRYFIQYKPNWWKPLSFVAGKFAYPWYRTPLTFDSDINPEGFAQTLSFDLKTPLLKNITLVGFELPFNEVSSGYDNAVYGGQLQTHWKFTDRLALHLYAAGVNFNRADSIAVAVARGDLRPSLANTNQFRTNASGQVVGYASKFLYVDLIGALEYKLHPRLPMQVLFNFVNNTRAATSERSGYWAEVQFGKLSEQTDFQFGYTFVRLEREAVIGAFNESDLRAATNVRNHRLNFGYQAYKNVQVNYTLWLGKLANPQFNSSLVPPVFRSACSAAPFTGCQDASLKRMQFDMIYKF